MYKSEQITWISQLFTKSHCLNLVISTKVILQWPITEWILKLKITEWIYYFAEYFRVLWNPNPKVSNIDTTCTVWKTEKFTLIEKIFREIKSEVTSFANALLSRNFLPKEKKGLHYKFDSRNLSISYSALYKKCNVFLIPRNHFFRQTNEKWIRINFFVKMLDFYRKPSNFH